MPCFALVSSPYLHTCSCASLTHTHTHPYLASYPGSFPSPSDPGYKANTPFSSAVSDVDLPSPPLPKFNNQLVFPYRLPAYQRFHALALPETPPLTTPTKEPPTLPVVELPLPFSYQELEEKFHCTDTVVSMLQKRKEICTFDKLKKSVQEMCRRYIVCEMVEVEGNSLEVLSLLGIHMYMWVPWSVGAAMLEFSDRAV